MRFGFIEAEKAKYPVRVLCATLEVSPSGYYAWRSRPTCARRLSDRRLAAQIAAMHRATRQVYGSPRLVRELRGQGIRAGKKRVERLMRAQGLRARQKRRFRSTTDSAHRLPVAPNVLGRQFDVAAPNMAWATDVTCVWTLEGWLFLVVFLDLFSRRVVGWATGDVNDTELALRGLRQAVSARAPRPGLVHHSDRGSPYASAAYRAALAEHGIVCSMSRVGDCWDNAVAESFFATLKTELLLDAKHVTKASAEAAIHEYIEAFYNLRRRHSRLSYFSPIEFELKARAVRRAA